jgi:hypothetical protein
MVTERPRYLIGNDSPAYSRTRNEKADGGISITPPSRARRMSADGTEYHRGAFPERTDFGHLRACS